MWVCACVQHLCVCVTVCMHMRTCMCVHVHKNTRGTSFNVFLLHVLVEQVYQVLYSIYCSQPSYNVPKIINPSEDIICPDASASTAIGAASIKHQSVEDLLGMSNSQTDGQTWEEAKAEIDKSLLKTLAPLDLCYDVIIDAKFYRVKRLPYVVIAQCYCCYT